MNEPIQKESAEEHGRRLVRNARALAQSKYSLTQPKPYSQQEDDDADDGRNDFDDVRSGSVIAGKRGATEETTGSGRVNRSGPWTERERHALAAVTTNILVDSASSHRTHSDLSRLAKEELKTRYQVHRTAIGILRVWRSHPLMYPQFSPTASSASVPQEALQASEGAGRGDVIANPSKVEGSTAEKVYQNGEHANGKFMFTDSQLAILQQAASDGNLNPDSTTMEGLAEKCGVGLKEVQTFFGNCRSGNYKFTREFAPVKDLTANTAEASTNTSKRARVDEDAPNFRNSSGLPPKLSPKRRKTADNVTAATTIKQEPGPTHNLPFATLQQGSHGLVTMAEGRLSSREGGALANAVTPISNSDLTHSKQDGPSTAVASSADKVLTAGGYSAIATPVNVLATDGHSADVTVPRFGVPSRLARPGHAAIRDSLSNKATEINKKAATFDILTSKATEVDNRIATLDKEQKALDAELARTTAEHTKVQAQIDSFVTLEKLMEKERQISQKMTETSNKLAKVNSKITQATSSKDALKIFRAIL